MYLCYSLSRTTEQKKEEKMIVAYMFIGIIVGAVMMVALYLFGVATTFWLLLLAGVLAGTVASVLLALWVLFREEAQTE